MAKSVQRAGSRPSRYAIDALEQRILLAAAIGIDGSGGLEILPAPAALTADAMSPGHVALRWQDQSRTEQGFQIERLAPSGFEQVATVATDVTTWVDTDVAHQTEYSYRVRAFARRQTSEYAPGVRVTTTQLAYQDLPADTLAPVVAPGVSALWSPGTTNSFIGSDNLGNASVSLNLTGLGQHCYVSIRLVVEFWDVFGNGGTSRDEGARLGADRWVVTANDEKLANTTISTNPDFEQAWPSPNPFGKNPAGTAADDQDDLDGRSAYTMVFEFHDADTSLDLQMKSAFDNANAGWSVQSAAIYLGQCGFLPVAYPPELISADAVDSNTVRVVEKPGMTANGVKYVYLIKRNTAGSQVWSPVLYPSPYQEYVMDYQAEPGTHYFYRLTHESALVGPAKEVTTPVGELRYGPYLNYVTPRSPNRIDLNWQEMLSIRDIIGYNVYRSDNAVVPQDDEHRIATSIRDHEFADIGLQPGTHYYYKVTAVFPNGDSEPATGHATTLDAYVATPQNLVVTSVTTTSASLDWDDQFEARSFNLYRSTDRNFYPNDATRIQSGLVLTSAADYGLTPGTRYYYKVTALDRRGGESGESNTAIAVTVDVLPSAPTDLRPTEVTGNRVRLEWTDTSNNESHFTLQKSLNGSDWEDVLYPGRDKTVATVTYLSASTEYYFRVAANNHIGASDWSNVRKSLSSRTSQRRSKHSL